MRNQHHGRIDPARRAAIVDCEALVAEAHGANLDPILDALDACLRQRDGSIEPAVVAGLRSELRFCAEACEANRTSARQLAGQLLCSLDAAAFAAVAGAVEGGPSALVPALASALYTRTTQRAWALCGALAALVAVQGLGAMCDRTERMWLAPAS